MTEEEKALAESCSRLHSISFAEAFKRVLFEHIEDEFDVATAADAYREYLENPLNLHSRGSKRTSGAMTEF